MKTHGPMSLARGHVPPGFPERPMRPLDLER